MGSVLGEIGLGIAIGEGITDVVVKYSKAQYKAKIDTLQGCQQKLESHLSILEGYKSKLKTIWDDEDAANYHKELDKQIAGVKNSMDQVKSQITMWQRAIDEMQETTSEQTDKIDTIKSILGTLDIKD